MLWEITSITEISRACRSPDPLLFPNGRIGSNPAEWGKIPDLKIFFQIFFSWFFLWISVALHGNIAFLFAECCHYIWWCYKYCANILCKNGINPGSRFLPCICHLPIPSDFVFCTFSWIIKSFFLRHTWQNSFIQGKVWINVGKSGNL